MRTTGSLFASPEDRFNAHATTGPCPFVTVGCGSMRVFFYPNTLAALESLIRAATEARDALAELEEKKP